MLCKPFDAYIAECLEQIKQCRLDEAALQANCPFELRPDLKAINGKYPYGVLLIHGLLDSPFSLRDLGTELKKAGILSRAVLLPGHGSRPKDLLNVKHDDWINTVRFGVESLQQEVEQVFLLGYSTGATLAIHHALNDPHIKGIVLLAPALKILPPVSTIVRWPILANFFSREDKWLCQEDEIDYVKYESVPFKPIIELGSLITSIQKSQRPTHCPMMMVMSIDDETVSAKAAIRFFTKNANDQSKFLLYANNHLHNDKRIEVRDSSYPQLHIKNMSHIALPFAPTNAHYGQQGDYPEHSKLDVTETIYGAYNRVEIKLYDKLNKLRLLKERRRALTYNPDFDYMSERIISFFAANATNQ